ncbi:MAG: NYN domain-containing protein, partial [Nocardioides sp.]
STDSALIIDAMDLLYANNVEAFAIVSSDSDFTSLALRLRESGKVVYGLGRQRTAISLQNACDRFIMLEVLGAEPDDGQAVDDEPYEDDEPGEELVPQMNLESVLTKAVNATADEDGWTTLGAIGNHLARSLPAWDTRTFGHGKLSSLVADQPYLETRPSGSHLQVTLKQPRKPAAKKSSPRRPAKKSAAKKS